MVNIYILLGNNGVFFATIDFHCRISVFSLKIDHLGHGGTPGESPRGTPGGTPRGTPPKRLLLGYQECLGMNLKAPPGDSGTLLHLSVGAETPIFIDRIEGALKKLKNSMKCATQKHSGPFFTPSFEPIKNRGLSPSNNFLARRRASPDDSGKLKPLFLSVQMKVPSFPVGKNRGLAFV